MYCRSFEEHSLEVKDAIEERDAEWLAAVDEVIQYNRHIIEGAELTALEIVRLEAEESAMEELKARMTGASKKVE